MNKKIGSNSNMTVTVLFCKYDVQRVASIVGTERAAQMTQSDRNVHMLVTEWRPIFVKIVFIRNFHTYL